MVWLLLVVEKTGFKNDRFVHGTVSPDTHSRQREQQDRHNKHWNRSAMSPDNKDTATFEVEEEGWERPRPARHSTTVHKPALVFLEVLWLTKLVHRTGRWRAVHVLGLRI